MHDRQADHRDPVEFFFRAPVFRMKIISHPAQAEICFETQARFQQEHRSYYYPAKSRLLSWSPPPPPPTPPPY